MSLGESQSERRDEGGDSLLLPAAGVYLRKLPIIYVTIIFNPFDLSVWASQDAGKESGHFQPEHLPW